MTTNRNLSIDAVSGLLIIHVIVGHIIQWTNLRDTMFYHIMDYIYFFMPWFFFKSGMFFRESPIKELLVKETKKLLLPYLIYTILGHFVWCVRLFFVEQDSNWMHYVLTPAKEILLDGSCMGNLPLWFLPSLFAVKIIVDVIHTYFLNNKYRILILAVTALIGFCVGMVANKINLNTPMYLANICTGIFFFIAGIILKELQYNKAVFVMAMCIYIMFCLFGLTIIEMRTNVVISGRYIYYPLSSLCGIILINNLFKYLQCNTLVKIGGQSLNYYVSHWIFIIISITIMHMANVNISRNAQFVIIAIFCAVALSIFNWVKTKIKLIQ